MLIECEAIKSAAEDLVSAFRIRGKLPGDVDSERVYKTAIEYATKASQEYFYGKPWLHEDSYYMDARENAVMMCTVISKMLTLTITEDDITDFVLRALFRMDDMAYEYEERHEYFNVFFREDRDYPVCDIQYSLVLSVFIVFAQYLLFAVHHNKKIDSTDYSDFITNHELLKSTEFYYFLDGLIQHHRSSLMSSKGGNTSCNF